MDCRADEIVCQLLQWFATHSHAIKQSLELVDSLWSNAGGQILKFLREHGEKLIALLSFSFAVWRWWIYRERILHKRLEEYIRESDARLGAASEATVEAILRLGRTAALPQPAFAVELRDLLITHGWRPLLRLSSVERQVEKQLGRALRGIRRRQQTVRAASQSLLEQQAQVHFLAGAIASARAKRRTDSKQAVGDDYKALREFQNVLQSPGHQRDVVAKECEAFQLLRLRESDQAAQAYRALQEFAADVLDERRRDLIIARSKRFRAQIIQSLANGAASLRAWSGDDGNINDALGLREKYGPYSEWDAIEQAEFHYVAAFIASKFVNWVHDQPAHLSKAEQFYRGVLENLPKRWFFTGHATRRLEEEARLGLSRVESARTGQYDERWLMI